MKKILVAPLTDATRSYITFSLGLLPHLPFTFYFVTKNFRKQANLFACWPGTKDRVKKCSLEVSNRKIFNIFFISVLCLVNCCSFINTK